MKSPIYPLFQISSFMHFKAGINPAYIYFFFFNNLESETTDCFLTGRLRTNDGFCTLVDPNDIVQVELGNPIFLHSLADTFFNVIYPPFSLENTKFLFQVATLVFSWLRLEYSLMS